MSNPAYVQHPSGHSGERHPAISICCVQTPARFALELTTVIGDRRTRDSSASRVISKPTPKDKNPIWPLKKLDRCGWSFRCAYPAGRGADSHESMPLRAAPFHSSKTTLLIGIIILEPHMKSLIFGALLSSAAMCGATFAQQNPKEVSDLERIHVEIGQEIQEAEREQARHQDGVLKELIQARIEILYLSQAIIQSRLIGAEVAAPTLLPSLMPDPELALRIEAEINAIKLEIEETKREIAATTGAIVAQPMTRLETDRVTLALLQGALMRARYGVVAPVLNDLQFPGPQQNAASDAPPSAEHEISPVEALPSVETSQNSEASAVQPAFSDPRFPEIDYSNPVFGEELPEGMEFAGWWAHGVMEDGNYMMINFSLVTDVQGMSDPQVYAICGKDLSGIFIKTGNVLQTSGKEQVEVTMSPDRAALPDTAMWDLSRSVDGDDLFFEGTQNIMFMRPSDDVSFTIMDASGKPLLLTFQIAGIREVLDQAFSSGPCTIDDYIWTKDNITLVQDFLNTAGYDVGLADGDFGAKSLEALRRWQIDNKLPATGRIDYDTLIKMGYYAKPDQPSFWKNLLGN